MAYLQKITIFTGLIIFIQQGSQRWYARFKVGKKHVTYATGEIDVDAAKVKATEAYYKRRAEFQLGIKAGAQNFEVLANSVIKDLGLDIANGKSVKTNTVYIGILKNYHIPYFTGKRIDTIEQKDMDAFSVWRKKEFGGELSSSSLQNHNAVLGKVYDKALRSAQITKYHIPAFDTEGKRQQRRASFTWGEFRKISDYIDNDMKRTKNKTSRMLLELLYDYIDFVVATGMRPGTEIEHVQWQDISFKLVDGVPEITVAVRKGKTTLYTGTRQVVVRSDFVANLVDLANRFPDRKADDLVFRLADGSEPKSLSRKFSDILAKLGLKESPYGERTLYSLRHSYITWSLKNKCDIAALAKQCGTSIEMIDRNYSHLLPSMFRQEFSGVAYEQKEPDSLKRREPSQRARDANIKSYGGFEKSILERGFI
ncbi:tyrosine-type recombinase/integrase [Alishewanella sp. BS5-314]|uniref:tyrosine-type recombinase/integrase n=1 Tax=Alishewanella sp. BS5-314 TaxID=2755587 RepID=UPI0021BB0AA5|nr:tyrosine-type recombinase/integrase [Alishewanella sp. BS5-314]MCT8124680.1 tyrosine-type recombinase/integrase [Alishewanella sp. BS5-314]